MTVIKSTVVLDDHRQRDGSIWVTERHEFDDGSYREFIYNCAAKDDPKTIMQQRAAAIDAAPPESSPDKFLTKLDAARDAYEAKDMASAKSDLAAATGEINGTA